MAEILVLQFLPLGRRRAEQRSASRDQVGAQVVEVLVDQEVFLFGADGREDLLGLGVAEQAEDAQGLAGERLHGAQKRGLLVERLAGPTEERGWNHQGGPVGTFHDERRARWVPGGVAAGLERGANTPGGEGTG